MFYLLMLFRDREGHCDVKVEHVEDGWKLGNWLRDQREAKKRGTLDEIRQERLEEAGVAWDLQDQNPSLGLLHSMNHRVDMFSTLCR